MCKSHKSAFIYLYTHEKREYNAVRWWFGHQVDFLYAAFAIFSEYAVGDFFYSHFHHRGVIMMTIKCNFN